ncbi:hypothetical protein QE441_003661 [Chryseobacterium sp. SORGH_AS909]|uniref:Uncharacterized protein n=1 Tax=Chryseobacterium camelliae TaxID=1265445 RepID=A0ABU0TIE2_9FLAO|nr:hypothetical protein [Chryseobacterium camelliae]MDQ1100527.1 hypothetical protein [Chryseobacterium sp. SORGH_AS_1048]MDR6087867.1 hypothetical protein [Chryseobacterium sp. SORGH_AS_0909]MDR6132243.1 hypothetical protein [Chryseobacterium sp. SORGH_AS_1175]MDT3409552.1 hypothetical protein [Pseudacidovorax intermedius]
MFTILADQKILESFKILMVNAVHRSIYGK